MCVKYLVRSGNPDSLNIVTGTKLNRLKRRVIYLFIDSFISLYIRRASYRED